MLATVAAEEKSVNFRTLERKCQAFFAVLYFSFDIATSTDCLMWSQQ